MKISLVVIQILFCCGLKAQLIGKITNEKHEVISFVSVYIEGTTNGTSSNEQGLYQLDLKIGESVVVFQQIGYEKQRKTIHYIGEPYQLNIELKEAIYSLQELEFVASREDPAYGIIRKAIERKKLNENKINNFECNAYTKGVLKILNAPEKILGQKVGNIEGVLDSNRQGLFYLSEAESILRYNKNEPIKEIMISSRIAGDDRGFSFNRASSLNFDLYKNSTDFGRSIISPIADYALSHYKYKLIGSNLNNEGLLIHKIQLIPKIKVDPVWNGYIYIADSIFTIYEFDGFIKGSQIKQEIFDTIFLNQNHIYNSTLSKWSLRNQLFKFNAGFFGFQIEGRFLLNLSEFKVNDQSSKTGKNEVLEILSGSNKKTIQYWDSVRPIPLTFDERKNYSIRDSIKKYKETRVYMDSMDRISNKWEVGNLLFGHTISKSFKRKYFTIESPLNTFNFNPVQGLNLGTKLYFSHDLDSSNTSNRISCNLDLRYGIADQTWRSELGMIYRFDPIRSRNLQLHIGRALREFNTNSSTNQFLNQIYNLYLKENSYKIYQQDFIDLSYATDLSYSARIITKISYSQRTNLINHSNYSFAYRNKNYLANAVTSYLDSTLYIKQKDLLQLDFNFRFEPFTKVWKTPEGIQKIGSDWPNFKISPIVNYYIKTKELVLMTKLQVNYQKGFQRWGDSRATTVMYKVFGHNIDIPEAIHPYGNPFPVNENDSKLRFKALSLYQRIGFDQAIEFHYEHNFEGLILDRIPILKYLGFKEVFSFSNLSMIHEKPYSEFAVGLANIGYKAIRYFRVDWVKIKNGKEWGPSYLRVSINNVLQIGK